MSKKNLYIVVFEDPADDYKETSVAIVCSSMERAMQISREKVMGLHDIKSVQYEYEIDHIDEECK